MFSITWTDDRRSHVAVGNGDTVMAIYSLLDRERLCGQQIVSVHIFDATTGLELNPETGLRDVIPRKDQHYTGDS